MYKKSIPMNFSGSWGIYFLSGVEMNWSRKSSFVVLINIKEQIKNLPKSSLLAALTSSWLANALTTPTSTFYHCSIYIYIKIDGDLTQHIKLWHQSSIHPNASVHFPFHVIASVTECWNMLDWWLLESDRNSSTSYRWLRLTHVGELIKLI